MFDNPNSSSTEETNTKTGRAPNRNFQKRQDDKAAEQLPPIAEMMRPFEKQIRNIFEYDLSIRNAYGERPNHSIDISTDEMKKKKEVRKQNRKREKRPERLKL